MNGLEITDANFNTLNGGNLVAFVDVTFNSVMTVKGFKIFKYKSGNGFFAAPPSEKYQKKDGSVDYDDRVRFLVNKEDGNPLMEELVRRFKEGSRGSATPQGNDEGNERQRIPF
tara:strand:- start:479 stop:820 length:342 start_codon:yes stop_codon:yes gene_type:complete